VIKFDAILKLKEDPTKEIELINCSITNSRFVKLNNALNIEDERQMEVEKGLYYIEKVVEDEGEKYKLTDVRLINYLSVGTLEADETK